MRTQIACAAAALAALAVALAASPAAAQAPAGPAPTPERLRLAEEVMRAAGGGDNLKATLARTLDAAFSQAALAGTDAQQARQADMQAFAKDRLEFYMPQILHAGAESYARNFDDAQLRDMIAFYQSPTGRALQAKLPEVASQTLQFMRPVVLKLQRDLFAHQCALAPCTAAQKAQLEKLRAAAGPE